MIVANSFNDFAEWPTNCQHQTLRANSEIHLSVKLDCSFNSIHRAIVETENVDLFAEMLAQDICQIIELEKARRLCVGEKGGAGHERAMAKQNQHVSFRFVMPPRKIKEPTQRGLNSFFTGRMRGT